MDVNITDEPNGQLPDIRYSPSLQAGDSLADIIEASALATEQYDADTEMVGPDSDEFDAPANSVLKRKRSLRTPSPSESGNVHDAKRVHFDEKVTVDHFEVQSPLTGDIPTADTRAPFNPTEADIDELINSERERINKLEQSRNIYHLYDFPTFNDPAIDKSLAQFRTAVATEPSLSDFDGKVEIRILPGTADLIRIRSCSSGEIRNVRFERQTEVPSLDTKAGASSASGATTELANFEEKYPRGGLDHHSAPHLSEDLRINIVNSLATRLKLDPSMDEYTQPETSMTDSEGYNPALDVDSPSPTGLDEDMSIKVDTSRESGEGNIIPSIEYTPSPAPSQARMTTPSILNDDDVSPERGRKRYRSPSPASKLMPPPPPPTPKKGRSIPIIPLADSSSALQDTTHSSIHTPISKDVGPVPDSVKKQGPLRDPALQHAIMVLRDTLAPSWIEIARAVEGYLTAQASNGNAATNTSPADAMDTDAGPSTTTTPHTFSIIPSQVYSAYTLAKTARPDLISHAIVTKTKGRGRGRFSIATDAPPYPPPPISALAARAIAAATGLAANDTGSRSTSSGAAHLEDGDDYDPIGDYARTHRGDDEVGPDGVVNLFANIRPPGEAARRGDQARGGRAEKRDGPVVWAELGVKDGGEYLGALVQQARDAGVGRSAAAAAAAAAGEVAAKEGAGEGMTGATKEGDGGRKGKKAKVVRERPWSAVEDRVLKRVCEGATANFWAHVAAEVLEDTGVERSAEECRRRFSVI